MQLPKGGEQRGPRATPVLLASGEAPFQRSLRSSGIPDLISYAFEDPSIRETGGVVTRSIPPNERDIDRHGNVAFSELFRFLDGCGIEKDCVGYGPRIGRREPCFICLIQRIIVETLRSKGAIRIRVYVT